VKTIFTFWVYHSVVDDCNSIPTNFPVLYERCRVFESTISKPNADSDSPLFGQSRNVTIQIWSSLKLRMAFDGWHNFQWAARQQLVIRHENQGD
jgi:hypothetical protein